MRTGFVTVQALPELTGRPWGVIAAAFCTALRPSTVRVTRGEVTSDAKLWRVTVYLDAGGLIERIEQEVEVELPNDVEHGHALMCRLDKLGTEPASNPNVDQAVQLIHDALTLKCRRCGGRHLTVRNEDPVAGFPIISYACRDCGLDSTDKSVP